MTVAKQILKNTFSLTAAEIAGKGIAMLFTIYLIRTIGPENNGVYAVAKTFIQVFLVFVWLGFEQVGIREVAKDRSLLHKYMGSILIIRLVISVLGFVAILAFLELFGEQVNYNSLTQKVILIHSILLFGNAIMINWAFQALEKMHLIAIRSFLLNLFNLVGLIIFVKNEDDFVFAVWIVVISFFINSAWLLVYYFKQYGIPSFKIELRFLLNLLGQSTRVGLVFLVVTFYTIIGVQLLSYFHGDLETGIYGAGIQIVILLLIPTGILQGAFFPQISRLINREERGEIVSKYILLNLIVGVIVSFSLFLYSPAIVDILGEKYAETELLLKYLSLTLLIQYLSTSYFSPLIAWKHERSVIYANISGLIANVAVNLALIPSFGYIGAAIGTIACEFAVLAVLIVIFKREQKTIYAGLTVKMLGLAIVVYSLAYVILELGLNIYLTSIISTILFLSMVIYFKFVTISEIRKIFGK